MRNLSKAAVVGVVAAGALAGLTATADAATPVVPGCVGSTFSAGATQPRPPGTFGHLIVSFARDATTTPGFGDGIQLLQAGHVPDAPPTSNTCYIPVP